MPKVISKVLLVIFYVSNMVTILRVETHRKIEKLSCQFNSKKGLLQGCSLSM